MPTPGDAGNPRPSTPPAAKRAEPIIEVRGASFGYADRVVVADVDLTVTPGETLAIVGGNGCGKSTLVRGLLGLNDQLGGEVLLFGEPAQRFRRRHLLGYVPQRHTLSSTAAATVTEVVAAGRLPHHGLFSRLRAHDREIIAHSLELVGMAPAARAEVGTLSGGQQRRVLIARALAGEPQALLMDEPTAGVDAANQRVLAEVFDRLARRGTTLLVVTHDIEPMAGALHRVVAMSAGTITYDGPLEPFLADPALRATGHAHHHDAPRADSPLGFDHLPAPRRRGHHDADH